MNVVAVVIQPDWPTEQAKREVQELQHLSTQTENEGRLLLENSGMLTPQCPDSTPPPSMQAVVFAMSS